MVVSVIWILVWWKFELKQNIHRGHDKEKTLGYYLVLTWTGFDPVDSEMWTSNAAQRKS